MRRTVSLVSLAALALTALAVAPATAAAPAAATAAEPPAVADQLLVGYRPGTTAADRAAARSAAGSRLQSVVVPGSAGRGAVELVTTPAGGRGQAERRFESSAGVDYAEPNWIYEHAATSNDPAYTGGNLWGAYGSATTPANQYGSSAGTAWAAGNIGSEKVYVGVIDEGVQITHPDLDGNIWANPVEVADGVDNDGNGYVDDLNGWDFDGGNNSVYDGTSDDHGTHVAGTIGAEGGNGIGVAGVAWDVTLIPVKFLGATGGTLANAVKAVDYLTDLKKRHGINLVASNNSWGGGGYSTSLYDAIERANAAGILFVAAAGNGGSDGIGDDNDATPRYPSSYSNSNIIAVASITSSGSMSSFSNYGATSVDLGAPGSSIASTMPDNGYAYMSGTSMATPHVTGAVVLYAVSTPTATAPEIKTAVLGSTVVTSSLASTVTGGRLDVSSYAAAPPLDTLAPGVPTGLTATDDRTGGSVTVSWSPVADADLSGYEIYRTGESTPLHTVGKDTVSWTQTGLTNGVSYSYVVKAFDTSGNRSAASTEAAATPTAPALLLSGSGKRVKGGHQVTLTISGGDPSQSLTIKRTGTSSRTFTVSYATTVTEKISTKLTSATYDYQVCQGTACSNTATVKIG